MKYLYSFKVSSLKICINYKKEKSSFMVGKPGDTTLIK